MSKPQLPACAACAIPMPERACASPEGRGPAGCPTMHQRELASAAAREYQKPEVHEFAYLASLQEAECYAGRDQDPYLLHPVKPRIQETCEFAHKLGVKRLGLAFCLGLFLEARMVSEIFTAQGFEVVSVACKAGRLPKAELGLTASEQVFIGRSETACNPILQAMVLNEAATGLNVLLGLCVGHDSLFLKYAQGLSTVLAVKDRVTGHNPLAPLYTSHTYYQFMKRPGF